MAFTDDDLKQLKTMILNAQAFYGVQPPATLSAILARLEAAEELGVMFRDTADWLCPKCTGEDGHHNENCEYVKIEKAWRKAAGK